MTGKRKTFLLDPPAAALPASLMFLRHARFRMLEDYFVKIASAVDALDDEQVWRRPNESSNGVTGQIIFAAKWLAEGQVSFYDDRRLNLEK